ncbi:araC-type DNA-binding domain-containing protein [Vibrio sp. JCM 19236]|nr:araC-type DNA-binding domain-containing protein [Vibrio sp. JCM 19236]
MHHAIDFQSTHFDFLKLTPRKPTLKHQLLCVESGMVTIRLGKQEYAIDKGEMFWVPANCLTSLSYFPDTKVWVIEASQRLSDAFPHQAGYIKPSNLLKSLLSKLEAVKSKSEHTQVLLSAVRFELSELKPKLISTPLTKSLSDWQSKDGQLSPQTVLVLKVREAEKMRLSGVKDGQIAEKWFAGELSAYQAATQAVLGER